MTLTLDEPRVDEEPKFSVTVFRYGTPGWATRPQRAPRDGGELPPPLPPVVMEQIVLAHRLRNEFVAFALDADRLRREAYERWPGVAAATATLNAAVEAVDVEQEAVNQAKREQHTRSPKTPAQARLKLARATAKECRAALKEAKAAEKENTRPYLDDIDARMKLSIKETYARYVQREGLYWGTWSDVLDHFKVSERTIIKQRTAGRPAAHKFHRFTGGGSLAVQIPRSKAVPVRTGAALADPKGPWRNVLRLGTWVDPEEWDRLPQSVRRRRGRSTVHMRIGDQVVEIPVILHRMPPRHFDATQARLRYRRVGPDTRVSVSITGRVPAPETRNTGPVLALHPGWRCEDDDGSIRVATWRSTEPVEIPSTLRDVVRSSTPTSGIVVLPAEWRRGLARPDQLRAERDLRLNPVREALIEWLRAHPQPVAAEGEPPAPTPGAVALWRAPGRFVTLARRWREDPPEGSADILRVLEEWGRADRLTWSRQEHGRDKHLGRRTDAWRRVAAWIAGIASRVVVDDTDLAAVTRIITAATAEDPAPSSVTDPIAKQRVDGAPGEFRKFVLDAARRDGVPVVTVSARNLSRQHTCGYVQEAASDVRPVLCHGCDQYYDPDASATLVMLMRADEQQAA